MMEQRPRYAVNNSVRTYADIREDILPIINRDTYYRITNKFSRFMMDKLVKGYGVHLPNKMGVLSIMGFPSTAADHGYKLVNWGKMRAWKAQNPGEHCPMLYYTNEHTDGIVYKIKWYKRGILSENKKGYSFLASRILKKRITNLIFDGKEYEIKIKNYR